MPLKPIAAAVIAVAVSAFAIACGGSSDSEKITSLVNEYVASFAAHDGKKACASLTPQAQRRVQLTAGILRGSDCAATLAAVSRLPTGDAARRIAGFHAGKVVIDGNEAGVIIEPAAPTAKPTRVVKVNGKWLIDGSVTVSR